MFLEKDHFQPDDFKRIEDQFLNRLPQETEEVIQVSDDFKSNLKEKYPEDFLSELITKEVAYFEDGQRQGSGRIFHLNDGDYIVVLTAVDQVGIRMMSYLITIIVLSLAGSVIAILFVSYYFSGKVIDPISKKIQKANAISVRNLHERLAVIDPDDEIGELAIAFNKMMDRLTASFEAQRSFIDNASHEMRNPLTAIMGEAEVALEKDRSPEEYENSLRSISHEADRLNNMVNNLLQLATINYREFSFKRELIDVQELLTETKNKFDFSSPQNQAELTFDQKIKNKNPLYVEGNNHLLQTALLNIFDNASKFSYYKPVKISVHSENGENVVITVRDQGVGIPKEDIPKVRQPFHRAANVRKIQGTGIGIPLSVKIIELHHGSFEISSELNKGTEAKIILPIVN
jgi:signal transduction histidine kinase